MAIYSDIDMKMEADEFGDVKPKEDKDAIIQSLMNCIFISLGSRTKFRKPMFGSNVRRVLFEKINVVTEMNLRNEISFSIENNEPRVKLIDVEVKSSPDQNFYKVNIVYEIISLSERGDLNLELEVIS